MTTIGTAVTLMDLARRLDPANGKIAKIMEYMNKVNEIIEDLMMVECNQKTNHLTTIRTGLPSVAWRLLNYGVQPTKSTTKQVTDACGMLEAYSQVDERLVDINSNAAEFRLSEEAPFLEAMVQELASTIFYGNTETTPEKFVGLAPRFDTPSASDTQAGFNIIDGGGTGSTNTSIYLVCWGDQACHGLYPTGTPVGFQANDLGKETITDSLGNLFRAYRTQFKWDIGMTVRDWKYVVRIANVDQAKLVSGTGAADLVKLMIRASERIPSMNMGRKAFYANRSISTALRLQTLEKTNVNLTFDSVEGKKVLAFDGIPIRRVDALLNTEAAVTGTFATV